MKIAIVYAHPDDESFGPAAVLARYARQGASIYGLFFTRGQNGESHLDPAPDPEELAQLRERDLREVAAAIGIKRLDVLDYVDGSLGAAPAGELRAHVLDHLLAFRPDVVLTFGPGGITHHPDHVAVHLAATEAFHSAREHGLGTRELYYDAVPPEVAAEMRIEDVPDGRPNTVIDVAETFPVKLQALRLHARHVADAREMVERLERQPQTTAMLHRAWPEVPAGTVVHELLSPDPAG